MTEQWKRIPNFPYEVSDCGRVRRAEDATRGPKKGELHKLAYNRGGYAYVNLTKDKKIYNFRIHTLVLMAFVGPPPADTGCMPWHWQCNHKDGDKTNNHVSNLEWITMLANKKHAVANALTQHGETHYMAKLKEQDVIRIRERVAAGDNHRHIAEDYGVSRVTISDIKRRKSWQRV